jgi:hypothetical protein
MNYVFWFSPQLLNDTFFILRRTPRDIIIIYLGLNVQYLYSCQILMTLSYSCHIFEKCWNIKFHESPFGGSRVVPCRQAGRQAGRQADVHTYRRNETNSRFPQFCERAYTNEYETPLLWHSDIAGRFQMFHSSLSLQSSRSGRTRTHIPQINRNTQFILRFLWVRKP